MFAKLRELAGRGAEFLSGGEQQMLRPPVRPPPACSRSRYNREAPQDPLRNLKIIVVLQVEPKLRRCAQRLGKPKRGVGGHAGLFGGDPLDPSARQAARLGESARRLFSAEPGTPPAEPRRDAWARASSISASRVLRWFSCSSRAWLDPTGRRRACYSRCDPFRSSVRRACRLPVLGLAPELPGPLRRAV